MHISFWSAVKLPPFISETYSRRGFFKGYYFDLFQSYHYDDVIMDAIASQIISLTIVYSNVYSGADQSKHQSSASLAFVWGIHRGPVNSPHKWPVTRKMFPFDDVIMLCSCVQWKAVATPLGNPMTPWANSGLVTQCGDIDLGHHWLR